ncbi:MAG: signal peptide peptidase SppA [Erythrobacter sp.]|jgi:protease-4|nr:signal peptide peptidase SppA [Erythrobacter sp.]
MAFVGKVWKLLVGIKDGLVLIFMLLFFSALFAILSARPSPALVREGALHIDMTGFVVEEARAIEPLALLLSRQPPAPELVAREIVRGLDAAASDDRIKAVVMDMSAFAGGGQVHLQEIAEAMERVRRAEKPVLTYALGYGDDHMHLASHASEVWLDPMGGAFIAGPGGSFLFYADLLEKLSVKARIYRAGEFKSAVEPYVRTELSPEARGNYEALYGSLWEEWQANVKRARPEAELTQVLGDPVAWVANAQGDLAQAALDARLVDRLGDRVEFGERVAEIAGADEWNDRPGAYAKTDFAAFLADKPRSTKGRAIGIVTVAGDIVNGDFGPGAAGSGRISDLLDEALDDDLAGLVVRVNSPGGSTLAAEEIRRAIDRYRAKDLPVAISFANIAASGGYWVATAGDRIFAQPETITGSIGVFAVIPTFEDAAERVGVSVDTLRTTPLSGQPDIIGGFNPEVDAILQASVDDTYDDFLGRVATARGMSKPAVDAIAQGRVWDGGTARQKGLVDQFGGLDDAAAWVASEAGLEPGGWHARFLESDVDERDVFIRQLLTNLTGAPDAVRSAGLFGLAEQRRLQMLARARVDLDRLTSSGGIQAYCVFCPAVTPVSQTVQSASFVTVVRQLLQLD